MFGALQMFVNQQLNLVDLVKSSHTSICLEQSASIHSRTSPPKSYSYIFARPKISEYKYHIEGSSCASQGTPSSHPWRSRTGRVQEPAGRAAQDSQQAM